jgi:hypothetical protein
MEQDGKQEGYWVGYTKEGSVIKGTGTYKDGVKISD